MTINNPPFSLLTNFDSFAPDISLDCFEKTRKICLKGFHKIFTVTVVDAASHSTTQKTHWAARLAFALIAFTVLSVVTLIGLVAHLLSTSHKNRYERYVGHLNAPDNNHSPQPSPPASPLNASPKNKQNNNNDPETHSSPEQPPLPTSEQPSAPPTVVTVKTHLTVPNKVQLTANGVLVPPPPPPIPPPPPPIPIIQTVPTILNTVPWSVSSSAALFPPPPPF